MPAAPQRKFIARAARPDLIVSRHLVPVKPLEEAPAGNRFPLHIRKDSGVKLLPHSRFRKDRLLRSFFRSKQDKALAPPLRKKTLRKGETLAPRLAGKCLQRFRVPRGEVLPASPGCLKELPEEIASNNRRLPV